MTTYEIFWISIGMVANGLFAGRMLLQWWASERAGKSVIPRTFWVFSFIAAIMMAAYGCYKRDPVIIVGQISALWIYARNLALSKARIPAMKLAVQDGTPLRSPTSVDAARIHA